MGYKQITHPSTAGLQIVTNVIFVLQFRNDDTHALFFQCILYLLCCTFSALMCKIAATQKSSPIGCEKASVLKSIQSCKKTFALTEAQHAYIHTCNVLPQLFNFFEKATQKLLKLHTHKKNCFIST